MIELVVPIRAVSDELIVKELLFKFSQIGSEDAAQVTLITFPVGFVTIVGSVIVYKVPI